MDDFGIDLLQMTMIENAGRTLMDAVRYGLLAREPVQARLATTRW